MVDEFQDVNPLQAEILALLGRDDLFAVGDRLQSIYGFRHADVGIFDRAAAELGGRGRLATLQRNFRSRAGAARRHRPGLRRRPSARAASSRSRPAAPDADAPSAEPPVELLVCDQTGWRGARRASALRPGARPRRARWAPASAPSSTPAAPPGDVVVLLRATGDMAAVRARAGRPRHPHLPRRRARVLVASARCRTSSPGSRCWPTRTTSRACGRCWPRRSSASPATRWSWSRRPPAPPTATPGRHWPTRWRAGAAARTTATALASFRERLAARARRGGALLARGAARPRGAAHRLRPGAARRHRRPAAHGQRPQAAATGPRPRGRRGPRPARRSWTASPQLARGEAAGDREGEAPVEGDTVHAVRLMTVHRAKGLEFEVVCVADLGRGRPNGRGPLRVSADGRVGLRLAVLGGGESEPALDWAALADAEARAEAAEERRLFYVAATRARERLILSGARRPRRLARRGQGAADRVAGARVRRRHGGAALRGADHPRARRPPGAHRRDPRRGAGRRSRLLCHTGMPVLAEGRPR